MGIIKPTITLKANSSSATTDAGPLSIALSLSATDSLAVTKVATKILDVKSAHGDSDGAGILWDASDYTADINAGVDGGFLYLRNRHATGHIYIGQGSAANLADGGTVATRIMTLLPGEFAWMPWDMTADIVYDANGDHNGALESWIFVRTGTA